eukprot:CAMPEP_0198143064 /NCGR_PEP_ID=MMETSP1443-20131203/5679_1 /TAXON_ID=186043 /ORGANISM="Entomoneis sp., Strain CCMP2396" /LENGTH=125 /DNA_ID=CAMNT_0043806203 /DNA_START=28 /DNA_END=405 /DNA_ORIENTATION=-
MTNSLSTRRSHRTHRKKTVSSLNGMFETQHSTNSVSGSSTCGSSKSCNSSCGGVVDLSKKLRRMKRRLLLEAVGDISTSVTTARDSDGDQSIRCVFTDIAIGSRNGRVIGRRESSQQQQHSSSSD